MSTEAETDQATRLHGGRLIARRLKAHGVTKLFTLSGGHLFSIYDGCREEGVDLVDVRHESAAAFAAEGWAKVTRTPGVAAVTAGPGVTNAMSALAAAQQSHSPMLVLGGRAPAMRWGQGSLQEIDHVPFVRPVTKLAATAESTAEIPRLVDEALAAAVRPHSGPTFLDFPLDLVFSKAEEAEPGAAPPDPATGPEPDGDALARAVALVRDAERPVVMAGSHLSWARGEDALRALVEELRVPVFLNGLARGCVAGDHELFFSRARSTALQGADVALVAGVPRAFRLGFGQAFGAEPEVVAIDRAEPVHDHPRAVAAELYGGVAALPAPPRSRGRGGGSGRRAWIDQLRGAEDERRAAEAAEFADARAPLHP